MSASVYRGGRGPGGGGMPNAGGSYGSPSRNRSAPASNMSPQVQPNMRSRGGNAPMMQPPAGPIIGAMPPMTELKPPKKPDKPLSSYMRFNKKVHEQIKAENPNMKMWDIAKLIGQMWRELPEGEKAVMNEEYEIEKARYNEELKAYYNSPAYQTYLQMKNREKQLNEQAQASSLERSLINETRMTITPAIDDEDVDEDGFSLKHIATARYRRNNKLMMDIMSESHVPDSASIVTTSRLKNLKCQVESLLEHENSFIDQLVKLEEVHASRKRKIEENRDKFNAEWEMLSSKKFNWQTITESELDDLKKWFKDNYNIDSSSAPHQGKEDPSTLKQKISPSINVEAETVAESMDVQNTEDEDATQKEPGAMSEPVMGKISSAFKLVLNEDSNSGSQQQAQASQPETANEQSNQIQEQSNEVPIVQDESSMHDDESSMTRDESSMTRDESSMNAYDENSVDVPPGSEGAGESDSVHSSELEEDSEEES